MVNPPLLQRLRQAVAVLFPPRSRRATDQVLNLADAAVPADPARLAEGSAERRRREELSLVRVELATLLNAMPQSRRAYPQLAMVEKTLGSEGLAAIHTMPVDLLQAALLQLESVVSNWAQPGLANLRSKMAVAIIDQGDYESPAGAGAFRTAAVLEVSRQEMAPKAAPAPSEEQVLASAYAALGNYAEGPVTLHGELKSKSARALNKPVRNTRFDLLPELELRDLQKH